ncbi:MAG: FkbM family methyltransferase, partial [Phycisphaerales bacterium]|nr:FkbM family methyltransferase [Phycisphaerales bacterium]
SVDISEHLVNADGVGQLQRLLDGLNPGAETIWVRPIALAGQAIGVRPLAEDARAFVDAFVHRRAMPTAVLPEGLSVLAIGAHVGYSCAMLLARDPACRVYAVEYEDACVDQCRRNLGAFAARATVLHAAAWGLSGAVHVTGADERSRRVHALGYYPGQPSPAPAATGLTHALSVPELMDRLGLERVGLLHLDINGAEASVLDQASPWLKRVDAAMVHVSAPASVEQVRWRLSEQGIVVRPDPRDAGVLMALSRPIAERQPRFPVPMERLEPEIAPG